MVYVYNNLMIYTTLRSERKLKTKKREIKKTQLNAEKKTISLCVAFQPLRNK